MHDDMPEPGFPVFGLADDPGKRWLNVWNRLWSPDGPLWMVVLGHGGPDPADHVGVVTAAKFPAQPTAYGSIGPTGVGEFPAVRNTYRTGWAVYADLDRSAVGVWGIGPASDSVALATVNARLDEYHVLG